MDPQRSGSIALMCARRLVSLVDADGRFRYRFNVATGETVEGYNTVRHAAAIWHMALTARELGAADLIEPAGRAMRWLIERHVQPLGSQGLPCVVENDRVELGGMALTLLASLELYRNTRDPAALALAAGMGRYLLTQRRDNGEFAHRRIFSSGKAMDEVSPFAPGQTLLALAELFSEVGDRAFLEPALETAEVLAGQDYGVRAQSHWMLYALNALEAVAPVAVQRAYACRIAGAMIAFPIYRTYGISTTIACHAESLAAYLKMIRRASARGSAVDMPSEAVARPALEQDLVGLEDYVTPDGDVLEGGDAPEVQIDTIQHAAAAFLGHAALYGSP